MKHNSVQVHIKQWYSALWNGKLDDNQHTYENDRLKIQESKSDQQFRIRQIANMNDKEPDAMATFFEFWIDNVAQFSLTAVGVLMNLTIIGIISSKRYVF